MRKLAAAALAAVVAFGVAGCAPKTQTIELDGCTFEAPAGEINKASDSLSSIVIDELEASGGSYAFVSWSYRDFSDYKYVNVSDMLDPDNLERTTKYDDPNGLITVRSLIGEGSLGVYDTLKYIEITSATNGPEDAPTVYSYCYDVQVHDDAYVSLALNAYDRETLDKYKDVADAMFDSVKLV